MAPEPKSKTFSQQTGDSGSPATRAATTTHAGSGPPVDGHGYTVTVTKPDELKRHEISDEELTVLISDGRSVRRDIFWGGVGAFLGALAPAAAAISAISSDQQPFGYWELIEVLVCFGGFIVITVMSFVGWKSPSAAEQLASEIRSRTACAVGTTSS